VLLTITTPQLLIFPRIAKLTSPDKLFSRLLYTSACLTTLYPVISLL
jgi:hypothetical protein